MAEFPFQHLDAYRKAVDLSAELMTIGRQGDVPPFLREMLARNGLSVLHHLVLGCRVQTLTDKKAYFSGAEAAVHEGVPAIDLLHRLGWLDAAGYQALTDRGRDLARLLGGLARSVDRLGNPSEGGKPAPTGQAPQRPPAPRSQQTGSPGGYPRRERG
jgi:hypothetical protein